MNAKDAISRLRDMQSQIIHGKNTFGDIANVVELQQKRVEELEKRVAEYQPFADSALASSQANWEALTRQNLALSLAYKEMREALAFQIHDHPAHCECGHHKLLSTTPELALEKWVGFVKLAQCTCGIGKDSPGTHRTGCEYLHAQQLLASIGEPISGAEPAKPCTATK